MVYRQPLSLDEQRRIRRDRSSDPDIKLLLGEVKRIRTRYVGEELWFLSPIAERIGRRVKILANAGRWDCAHETVDYGRLEMIEEAAKWGGSTIRALPFIPEKVFVALELAGYETIGDLMRADEGRLVEIPGISYKEVDRLSLAMRRIGAIR